jgi:heme exporter protein C
MWGTWWVWDARLTSELILLFLYLGVIALYTSFEDKEQGSKAAGIIAVVGVVNLPIIHYSVEWWNTLHQGATITKFDKPSIAPEMLWPLLISILGMAALCGYVVLRRLQNEILRREFKRSWVVNLAKDLVERKGHAL